MAREHDLLFLVDAAQTAGVMPIDVQAMCIDLLAFPGHKSLLGPDRHRRSVRRPARQRRRLARRRHRRRFLQRNAAGRVSLLPRRRHAQRPRRRRACRPGIQYVLEQGLEKIHAHEVELIERLWQKLDEIGGYEVFGHRDRSRAGRHAQLPQRAIAGGRARRHPRSGVRHRHPPRPALRPVHPPLPGHVSRRSRARQPGAVQHRRRHRSACRGPCRNSPVNFYGFCSRIRQNSAFCAHEATEFWRIQLQLLRETLRRQKNELLFSKIRYDSDRRGCSLPYPACRETVKRAALTRR